MGIFYRDVDVDRNCETRLSFKIARCYRTREKSEEEVGEKGRERKERQRGRESDRKSDIDFLQYGK